MADVLSNFAGGILTNLASLAFKDLGHLSEIKTEAEKLQSTVLAIQSLLLVAEDPYYSGHPQVKDWIAKLKDAMEDADNLLDDLNTEALRKQAMDDSKFTKKVRVFFSSKNQVVFGLKMAHEIKAIRERLDFIKGEKNFHLDEHPREVKVARRRVETHSSSPAVVVGREEDKNRIVELLLSSNYEEESVSVISIWGIGGMGKTTLIKLVFNDERVKKGFDLKIWICVSNEFDVKLISKNMLSEINGHPIGDLPLNALINQVQQTIDGKKYLVVLDDLWNGDSNKWYELKELLMCGVKGSKIIVSTRNQGIGEMTKTLAIYELKGLSSQQSWDLFKKMAFELGSGPRSANHERIGKEILAKCKGVPLAIQTIGRTLFHKRTESEWLAFKDKELRELKQNETDIMPTLQVSYNYLPLHLKHCFAICSLYPKDYKIKIKELINLWIAQGYILRKEHSRQSMEDIGFEYFEELVWRSFFQDVEVDGFGSIKSCKMHDLMHDLAQMMNGECVILSSTNRDGITRKTRHVNLMNKGNRFYNSQFENNKIRTILFSHGIHPFDKWSPEFVANSRHLRALLVRYMNVDVVPDFIYKLNHLRYLSISGSINILPNSISKLQNLQILDLSNCYALKTLPKDITKLVNLSQLDLTKCDDLTHIPCGIKSLTTLQVLSLFVVSQHNDSARLSELQDLNNLRGDLAIIHLENVRIPERECRAVSLKAKQHLRSLRLCWARDTENEHESYRDKDKTSLEELQPHVNLKSLELDGYRGVNFPPWLSTLSNMVEIRIANCRNCQIIPPLNQISSLKRMEIYNMQELEYIEIGDDRVSICNDNNHNYHAKGKGGEVSLSFLDSLEELVLNECPKLKGWQRRSSSSATVQVNVQDCCIFPCLSYLKIQGCPNLMSNWIQSCPSLTYMELTNWNVKAMELMLKSSISTYQHHHSSSSSSSSSSSTSMVSPPHSLVETLDISAINDLQVLPEDSLQYFTSLKILKITACPNLRGVSQAMRHLISLTCLQITGGQYLDDIFDIEGGHALKSLRDLYIDHIPKLVSLPESLQHATNLQHLGILYCDNLKCFPEWMPNLTALRSLLIRNCSSELLERCKNNTAQDWPLISHIPYIQINRVWIQKNGCYLL